MENRFDARLPCGPRRTSGRKRKKKHKISYTYIYIYICICIVPEIIIETLFRNVLP